MKGQRLRQKGRHRTDKRLKERNKGRERGRHSGRHKGEDAGGEDKERRDIVDERYCGGKVGERKRIIGEKKRHLQERQIGRYKGMGRGEMGGGGHMERETYI